MTDNCAKCADLRRRLDAVTALADYHDRQAKANGLGEYPALLTTDDLRRALAGTGPHRDARDAR